MGACSDKEAERVGPHKKLAANEPYTAAAAEARMATSDLRDCVGTTEGLQGTDAKLMEMISCSGCATLNLNRSIHQHAAGSS